MNANIEAPVDVIEIDQLCVALRAARDTLRALAGRANEDIETIKREHLPGLRLALAAAGDAEIELRDAVQASDPALWRRTRSRILHGIKIGWQKQRGKVDFADEAKTIERMRQLLPKDQVALLIRVREAVHKPAVYDLTAADLRRLGITVADDCDQVVVKDIESELDRALEALLDEITRSDGRA